MGTTPPRSTTLSNQVKLHAEPRPAKGKGASGRLRKEGRVPGILYGYQVEPTAVSVDALELYHTLHTEAGSNVLIRLELGDETHLTIARDLQYHPVRGETLHVDFIAVDRDVQISVEIPVHLTDEDDATADGVLNQILYTVPILVKPLDVPNSLTLSVAGMEIGDLRRVEDLADQLPEGAEFDIDPDRTVITVNAPVSEAALEAMEEAAGIEAEEPELVGEQPSPEESEAGDDA
jgi:large subunit ribosomal protein L25